MEKEVLVNEEAFTAYLDGGSAIFSFERPKSNSYTVDRPSSPVEKSTASNTLGEIAKWGEENLFPQQVYEECQNVSFISSVLERKAEMLFAGGIVVGKTKYSDEGAEVFTPVKDQDWEAFKRTCNVDRYLIEAAKDLYWFYNVFPEVILSKDRKKIVSICTQEAMFCRWEKPNENTGISQNCYINANWKDKPGTDPKNGTIKIPALDPYFNPAESLKLDTRGFKYIYPLSYSSPGRVLYQLASWDSIRKSGWLDLAVSIPKFKTALMKNQITIKYHVKIPDYFWSWKYEDWSKKTPKEKTELKTQEIKNFSEFLSGAEKAGKIFVSSYKFNEQTKTPFPGWEIVPIDDKLKDGSYLEDSQEASSHILFSLGFHSAFLGDAPGKGGGQGAGAGSDIREAMNLHVSFIEPHVKLILEPFYLIRNYNGWDEELEFRIQRPIMQTLNQVSPKNRESRNGTI